MRFCLRFSIELFVPAPLARAPVFAPNAEGGATSEISRNCSAREGVVVRDSVGSGVGEGAAGAWVESREGVPAEGVTSAAGGEGIASPRFVCSGGGTMGGGAFAAAAAAAFGAAGALGSALVVAFRTLGAAGGLSVA